MIASPLIALMLFAAPQLKIPAAAPIQLDGTVQEAEWAGAAKLQAGKHFVYLQRQGRWLAVAFGAEGRYAGEVVRLQVSDEFGAWQTAVLLTGGQPTLPPALWARAHPSVVFRLLRDTRAPLVAPRGALARMNVTNAESWSAEYLVRLGVLGIGRGDARRFRFRLVVAPRGGAEKPAIIYPEGTPEKGPINEHALLESADQWGADETWPPLSSEDSIAFDDHYLLWRLAVEQDRFNIKGAEGQIVIANAVRPRSEAKIGMLRAQIEAGMKRNPTLPAWKHFLGRLLHEANRYDEAAEIIESIPAPLRRMDAFALLAAEHALDTGDWKEARLIASAYPDAVGMRELAVAANTVRLMSQSEAEVEKKSQERAEPLPVVRITTRKGVIEVELFEDAAPHAVTNFIDLAGRNFFDGMRFGPVIGSTIARSGDPRSRAGGSAGPDGPPWKLRRDRSPRQPLQGRLVAIADEKGVTHGSQFGILLAPVVADREEIVVFGRVIKGMDVLQSLEEGDALTKTEVVRRRNHSYDALASRVK